MPLPAPKESPTHASSRASRPPASRRIAKSLPISPSPIPQPSPPSSHNQRQHSKTKQKHPLNKSPIDQPLTSRQTTTSGGFFLPAHPPRNPCACPHPRNLNNSESETPTPCPRLFPTAPCYYHLSSPHLRATQPPWHRCRRHHHRHR